MLSLGRNGNWKILKYSIWNFTPCVNFLLSLLPYFCHKAEGEFSRSFFQPFSDSELFCLYLPALLGTLGLTHHYLVLNTGEHCIWLILLHVSKSASCSAHESMNSNLLSSWCSYACHKKTVTCSSLWYCSSHSFRFSASQGCLFKSRWQKSILYQQTSDHILESISTLALGIGRFRLALLIRILHVHELWLSAM